MYFHLNKRLIIWILQTGEPLHVDNGNPRPMRAMNLSNALIDAGHKVVLWSSAFHHQQKMHRTKTVGRIVVSPDLEVRLIPSPGYRRHIGFERLWDHLVLAYNLSKLLATESELPNLAFIGYPPIETAAVMTRWLARRGVVSILDIKDQWPNIFLKVLPRSLQILGRIVLVPYFYFARRAMRDATSLSAISANFLRWSAHFAGRSVCELDRVVPLTAPFGQVPNIDLIEARKWWSQQGVQAADKALVCFVGSHTNAFDFAAVVRAAEILMRKKVRCDLVICGDGPLSMEWRRQARELSNIRFMGWVDRAQIEALAEITVAFLAPYKNTTDFIMSVPNKVIDALLFGVPILSPLEGEVAKMIDVHGVGLRYGESTGINLHECIELLISNPKLQRNLSENAKAYYCEYFEFNMVYKGLVNHIEALVRDKPEGFSNCPR
jgi:glycosyltransferase involved in cell wall biosynthesis